MNRATLLVLVFVALLVVSAALGGGFFDDCGVSP